MSNKLKMIESYVNNQINLLVEEIKESNRYRKSYLECGLSVFKKVQNKIIELKKLEEEKKNGQRNIIDDWFDKAEHYQITDVMKYELLEMLDLPREDYDFSNDKNLLDEDENEGKNN